MSVNKSNFFTSLSATPPEYGRMRSLAQGMADPSSGARGSLPSGTEPCRPPPAGRPRAGRAIPNSGSLRSFGARHDDGVVKQKVKFQTLGCRLNQYETQAMREQFQRADFEETTETKEADVFVLNTCTVTHESDRESRYLIRKFHRDNPKAKIAVTGCYVERNEEEIKAMSGVTLTVLNRQKSDLVRLLDRPTGLALEPVALPSKRAYPPLSISEFEGRSRAYLKIQDGCNHACTFCKVVLVRGPARSRPMHEVMEEANRLAQRGYQEVVLTGIQLGSYGYDFAKRPLLAELIEQLSGIDGLRRVRLSSIEPTDVTRDLIELMATNQKLCPHLHVPLQSGSDRILQKMNRRYRRDAYRSLIQNLNERVSDFVLTTDVMVGFPGETGIDFDETVDLLLTVRPYKLHIFPFSAREGTRAARFEGALEAPEMARRRKVLLFLEGKLKDEVQRRLIGRQVEVLIEEASEEAGWVYGRSTNYVKVRFPSADPITGGIRYVQVERIEEGELIGNPLGARSENSQPKGMP